MFVVLANIVDDYIFIVKKSDIFLVNLAFRICANGQMKYIPT